MKRFLKLVLFLCLISGAVRSQPCLPNGITFIYQYQIDNFQINHPNCAGLDNMVSIGGVLVIQTNQVLESLDGLDNVVSIGGNLKISSNPALISIAGLTNLTSIGGYLWINGSFYSILINL